MRSLKALALASLVLAAVLAVRTWRIGGRDEPVAPAPPRAVEVARVAEALAGAIRIPTVSSDESEAPAAELAALRAHLEAAFPRVFATLEREEIAGGTLLLRWPGADPALAPVLLLAHQDVVPADPGDRRWTQPPFAGALAGGFVWGRGAIDDKGSMVAILAAVDALLESGFAPVRTVLLGFGHDEERGGAGARALAARLAERSVRLALVLDEGLAITEELVPGVERPVALLGTTEKGYASFELVAEAPGGHSSMPARETAISILARAVDRVAGTPMPSRGDAPVFAMLDAIAPAADLPTRFAVANRWLLGPLLERQLAKSPATDALLRTTLVPTVIAAGGKENVVPAAARAVVNARLLPGDSVAEVETELRRRIDDARVTLRPPPGGLASEASPKSPVDGWGYRTLARSVREVLPEAVVAPGLMVGATDARHFVGITEETIRFQPIVLRPGDPERFHGVDERVSLADLELAVRVYARFLENAARGRSD
ncbi:MAG TPA: M20/M25/M40 family metallo-hydrolase [Thermoanaerobaculia bacterium]|nr:M20/M25/M40 family metallo-hydrolase [Thermoanaerobaculia bacterium]